MASASSESFFDFRRALSDWRIPSFDLDAVAKYQRKNIEALTQANQMALEGTQAWLRLNLEIARQSIEEFSSLLSELTKPSGSVEDRLARQAELSKKAIEKSITNFRDMTEVVTKANSDALGVLTKRVSESLDEVRELTQKAA